MINAIIWLLALLTLLSNVFIIFLLLTTLSRSYQSVKGNQLEKLLIFLNNNRLKLVLIVSTTATLGSLFFSEVVGLTPCILCWWQRIFMYPQPLISLLALIRKEKTIFPYLLLLNTIGLPISLYHYLIQRLPQETVSGFCQIGGAVSCTKNLTLYFGYITIPFMAASAFLLNIIFLTIFRATKSAKIHPGGVTRGAALL